MLTFTLNNKPFILSTDTSVRLTWRNPACNIDEFPGDVGLGVDIPVNDNNSALLGHPGRFKKYKNSNDREFPGFKIRYSGYLLMSGTLVIQSSTDESYSGWLRSTVGNLGSKHREKYIGDIAACALDNTFVNKANYDPLTDPYACPKIYNQKFFSEKSKKVTLNRPVTNPDYVDLSWWQDVWKKQQDPYINEPYETEELTEAFRMAAAYFVNDTNLDGTVKAPVSSSKIGELLGKASPYIPPLKVNVVSPMLFLSHVLKMLFLDADMVINDNFLKSHPDLSKLLIYNNYDITNMDLTRSNQLVTGTLIDNITVSYVSFAIDTIVRNYAVPFRYKALLPQIKLKDFLLSVQNLLNVFFHIRRDGKVDIIDRESILDAPALDLSKYIVNKWKMGEQKNTSLKFMFEHDKDDMYFQERWEDVDDLRENEGDAVESLEQLQAIQKPFIGEIRFVKNINLYYKYDYIQAEHENPLVGNVIQTNTVGWNYLSSGFQNGFYNKGQEDKEEIKTSFSTLMGSQTTLAEQKGNINTMRFAYSNFSPRLLFYTGNNTAKNETDNMALDWEKETKGLLQTRWPNWSRFWCQRQPVEGQATFTANMIDYVVRNIFRKFRGDDGEFIIEELETEFGMNEIGITTIRGYKSAAIPKTVQLTGKWDRGNLIIDRTLIDFTRLNTVLDFNFDLIGNL